MAIPTHAPGMAVGARLVVTGAVLVALVLASALLVASWLVALVTPPP